MSNLRFMLISFVHMLYELSILFFLDDLEELYDYMLIWSFILWWNYALMLFKFAGINFESLLKPLFLQQFRKPTSEEMASLSDVIKLEVFDGANLKH